MPLAVPTTYGAVRSQETKLGVRAFGLVGFTVGACSATSCQLGAANRGDAELVN